MLSAEACCFHENREANESGPRLGCGRALCVKRRFPSVPEVELKWSEKMKALRLGGSNGPEYESSIGFRGGVLWSEKERTLQPI